MFRLALILFAAIAFPNTAPAPLVYTPGEGWTYEPVGSEGRWKRDRAEDQLAVAREAFEAKKYRLALKAARRTVKEWPLSDFAPEAQYFVGRSREARNQDYKAFQAYQKLVQKYPKSDQYQEVLNRQFEIANRFLAGQWYKLWGYIPFFPSREKAIEMYQDIIRTGPYSDIAPQAQLNIGAAWEIKKDYRQAVQAYELAADRYHDQPKVASDAVFRAGLAYQKQAKTAEYDQGVADEAIATFSDFLIMFPDDPRVDQVRDIIASLRQEQARGSYAIARFYEKKKKWKGALIYYNEVLLKDADGEYAEEARARIARIKEKEAESPATGS